MGVPVLLPIVKYVVGILSWILSLSWQTDKSSEARVPKSQYFGVCLTDLTDVRSCEVRGLELFTIVRMPSNISSRTCVGHGQNSFSPPLSSGELRVRITFFYLVAKVVNQHLAGMGV